MDLALPPGTRPFRPGDETGILAASLACLERGELDGLTRHDLEDAIRHLPGEPDTCVVAEDGGGVAGWVIPPYNDLTVDLPYRRRGHGTRLAAAGRVVAARMGLPDLRLWVPRRPGPEAFARSVGLRHRSSLWRLRLPSATPATPPRFPGDVVVRRFEPGIDEEAYVALVNASFVDHPSPLTYTPEQVRFLHALPGFDPTSILLVAPADDRDRLVGFCRIDRHEDDAGRTVGDVRTLGVVPSHRGRGLGRELLRWGTAELRERGAGDVYLNVEGENDRALELYRRNGFEPAVEWPQWVLPLAGDERAG